MDRYKRLPFVQLDAEGNVASNWKVAPSGDYPQDCKKGRDYFASVEEAATRNQNPLLFSTVLKDMILAGNVTGVEIGFLHAASMRLLS